MSCIGRHFVIFRARSEIPRSRSGRAYRAPYSICIRTLAAIGWRTPAGTFSGAGSWIEPGSIGIEVFGCFFFFFVLIDSGSWNSRGPLPWFFRRLSSSTKGVLTLGSSFQFWPVSSVHLSRHFSKNPCMLYSILVISCPSESFWVVIICSQPRNLDCFSGVPI